jgi:hypothetical protein
MLEDLLKNPALRQALAAGEERAGQAIAKLLASPSVAAGLQTLLSSASAVREGIDRGVRAALEAANVPTRDDVADLERRLGELESILDGLASRLGGRDAGGDQEPGGDGE